MDYLTFEDRDLDLPALMLLVVSLRAGAPASRLHMPARDLSVSTVDWLASQPNVILHRDLWAEDTFWNIKPFLLEKLLQQGLPRVTWLDADLIVTADPSSLFSSVPDKTIVVAEEGFRSRHAGTAGRTHAIGCTIGRELGYTVNSCIVSVTADHLPLLRRWKSILRSDAYKAAGSRYLAGDQDVLGGLLGSEDFGDTPVQPVRSGIDIAHDMLPGDYSAPQRFATLHRGEPRFVHAQGRKLWRLPVGSRAARSMRSQLSVYRHWAKAFQDQLPADKTAWLGDDGVLSRTTQRLFPSRPSLRGLPVGTLGSALNTAYILRNTFRRDPVFQIGQAPDKATGPGEGH